jgi:hypothetical protein
MGELGELERPGLERNRARLFAAFEGEPAVQAPQGREPGVWEGFLRHVGRAAQGRRRQRQIIEQQIGFGDAHPHRELIVAGQRAGTVMGQQDLDGIRATAALERRRGACKSSLDRGSRHSRSIQNGCDEQVLFEAAARPSRARIVERKPARGVSWAL